MIYKKEFYLGFVISIIGVLLHFRQFYYELELSNKYMFASATEIAYINSKPTFNYLNGIWLPFIILGLALILDSLEMIPDIEIRKSIKKIRKRDV